MTLESCKTTRKTVLFVNQFPAVAKINSTISVGLCILSGLLNALKCQWFPENETIVAYLQYIQLKKSRPFLMSFSDVTLIEIDSLSLPFLK